MTSGSGVWLSVCLGAWWCVWSGPEKSIAPRVTIAWANRSAGQRTFGLAEEKEMKKKKKSSSRRKEGERRGEEEQASAVMGSKVESAPSSISSTLLGDYEYSVPSSTVQYYQYEYNTYPTIIRSKCLGPVSWAGIKSCLYRNRHRYGYSYRAGTASNEWPPMASMGFATDFLDLESQPRLFGWLGQLN
ncbi:hypothetical protein CI102_11577 [Trichoderma harzianum]|nr:hypothetical protein CI102_11577 [Trichoderma harzianum]